jgi:aryl-alcohol dehydrogenase-like predicted oxidoreductase
LAALDSLLTALESKYPDLLYVHDQDLHAIVTEGAFQGRDTIITVSAMRQDLRARVAHQGAM